MPTRTSHGTSTCGACTVRLASQSIFSQVWSKNKIGRKAWKNFAHDTVPQLTSQLPDENADRFWCVSWETGKMQDQDDTTVQEDAQSYQTFLCCQWQHLYREILPSVHFDFSPKLSGYICPPVHHWWCTTGLPS